MCWCYIFNSLRLRRRRRKTKHWEATVKCSDAQKWENSFTPLRSWDASCQRFDSGAFKRIINFIRQHLRLPFTFLIVLLFPLNEIIK